MSKKEGNYEEVKDKKLFNILFFSKDKDQLKNCSINRDSFYRNSN